MEKREKGKKKEAAHRKLENSIKSITSENTHHIDSPTIEVLLLLLLLLAVPEVKVHTAYITSSQEAKSRKTQQEK